jgi:hypothetical protein
MLPPQKLWKALALFAVLLGLALPGHAKVGSVPLDAIIDGSDVVVVAHVESTTRTFILFGSRHARAKVLEVWKGDPGSEVEFLASPTWTCDISDAEVGETAVLFLKRSGSSYEIAHSGRGRLPVRQIEGRPYGTLWPGVILPEEVGTRPGPDPEFSFIESVSVDDLRTFVMRRPKSSG